MIHTWIIAEQVKCDFRITHIMQSEDVPHDDFRKEIIDICNSYSERLIPHTTANIFMVFEKVDSDALFLAEPKKQSEMFIRLKTEHKTGCWDIISIQRAAWCLQENLDVLEFHIKTEAGKRTMRLEIIQVSENFLLKDAFRTEIAKHQ